MGYDYTIAVNVLTESEKNRMICAFLNTDQSTINWDDATKTFKSASVASFRRCIYNSLKKIEDAGGKDGSVGATPGKATPKSGGGKKRKAAEDGDDEEDISTPTKKKGGRKPKGGAAAESPSPIKDETKVKAEAVDDED